MQRWLERRPRDGFNVMFPYLPEGLDDFVDQVIPELQARGLFRHRIRGRHLAREPGPRAARQPLLRQKPMREDAIFRIYSMSKPITAVALMMLVEEGALGLDDLVHHHIPSWKKMGVYASGMPTLLADQPPQFITTPTDRAMKVVDLVTHTSGLTYGFMMRTAVDAAYRKAKINDFNTEGGLEGMMEQLSHIPLEFSPGTQWNYSVAIDVMGYLVEKCSGQSFGEFLRTRLFDLVRSRPS
jgi:CubicO group peptidase (beta-lactamase class C family)